MILCLHFVSINKYFDLKYKDGCRIDLAILADGVVLNENVELGRGCILGPGVIIAARTTIPANTRLMSSPLEDDFNQDDSTTN